MTDQRGRLRRHQPGNPSCRERVTFTSNIRLLSRAGNMQLPLHAPGGSPAIATTRITSPMHLLLPGLAPTPHAS